MIHDGELNWISIGSWTLIEAREIQRLIDGGGAPQLWSGVPASKSNPEQ
jgi:hypothetical protein